MGIQVTCDSCEKSYRLSKLKISEGWARYFVMHTLIILCEHCDSCIDNFDVITNVAVDDIRRQVISHEKT